MGELEPLAVRRSLSPVDCKIIFIIFGDFRIVRNGCLFSPLASSKREIQQRLQDPARKAPRGGGFGRGERQQNPRDLARGRKRLEGQIGVQERAPLAAGHRFESPEDYALRTRHSTAKSRYHDWNGR